MYDARAIANFMLDYADERRVALTNMAVLKHIYFAHGWHLAACGKPLISNRIEAWQYGPVIRAVYDCFKEFDARPITSRAYLTDWETGEVVAARADFGVDTIALLKATLDYYSGFGAYELSELTHMPGGPWDQVWNAGDGKVRLNMEISNQAIHDYFIKEAKSASIQ
ncbi:MULTISPECIES: Panacea domain-containing protein [Sphingobium]|uniref:Antitoxin SocA-like Panacea domain-containing protein n=1 Tax=Sphingobium fuliginis (strain ATCC 27551) TaxID=336203 RepID=A0ABQ1ENP5_SPHSA|nr:MULTISPECIES: type II toxin-antitoxin system antitoxin SocA domain-containing protein [Sphingobium]RYM00895.1 DUF4065 domain-containing protein [Sphingobium fuliginis]WDA38384.1 DUF4065 domain-containing protein [Sphingobium sp. YC-XJ3]GFZ79629.1 hypothetical protein GCM10019071_05510 [Sphingobium fuliginis]